jgi:hypothetical protein
MQDRRAVVASGWFRILLSRRKLADAIERVIATGAAHSRRSRPAPVVKALRNARRQLSEKVRTMLQVKNHLFPVSDCGEMHVLVLGAVRRRDQPETLQCPEPVPCAQSSWRHC